VLPESFGLAEAPLDQLSNAFAAVVGAELPGEEVDGPIEAALEAMRERSADWLLAATRSTWTAFFGEDPRQPAWELPDRIGGRTLLVSASRSSVGFTLREPGRAGPLDAVRTLFILADEPRPQVHGAPLAIEDAEPSSLGLDSAWLDRYLRKLGVDAFDPGFHLPPGSRGLLLKWQRSAS
jgi:hypothetical protein